jgi:hypothetical protein
VIPTVRRNKLNENDITMRRNKLDVTESAARTNYTLDEINSDKIVLVLGVRRW